MPLSPQHKLRTRERIVETARILFNRHGFDGVSIDVVMKAAGLTRGGFYNHFKNKETLYAEVVTGFLMGRGAQWRSDAGIDPSNPGVDTARKMMDSYLSIEHLGDLDGQCPMIALPSDVARAGPEVQLAYQGLLEAMVGLFETSLQKQGKEARKQALSLAALCVGGMILSRTLPNSDLADEVRLAAQKTAAEITGS